MRDIGAIFERVKRDSDSANIQPRSTVLGVNLRASASRKIQVHGSTRLDEVFLPDEPLKLPSKFRRSCLSQQREDS